MRPTARHVQLAAESLQVMAGQALAIAGSLFLLRALSQQFLPSAYGVLALGLTGSLLVSLAISGGTTVAIGRFFSPAKEAGASASYLRASGRMLWRDQRLIAALTAFTAVVFALVLGPLWMRLALGAGCAAITSSWLSAQVALFTSGRHRLAASVLTALDPWVKLLLLLLYWRWMAAGPAQTLLIYACGSALVALIADRLMQYLLGYRLPLGPLDLDAIGLDWLWQMQDFARPFTRFGLLAWLQQSSDRWALQAWSGPMAVGQYAVLHQLGYSSVGIISNMLNTLVAPILYGRAGDGSNQARNQVVHRLVKKLTLIGLVLSVLTFAVALLLHHWLFALLVAPAYRGLSFWFPWLVLAGSLFSVGQMITLKFMSDNRTAELGRVKSLTALLGALFNALGAAFHGIAGIVVAQNVFSLLYLLWMIYLGGRVLDSTCPVKAK